MSEKGGVVQFKYENGNMIIYNPDINAVIKTLQVILNNDLYFDEEENKSNKYVFKNQRIHTLTHEYLDK